MKLRKTMQGRRLSLNKNKFKRTLYLSKARTSGSTPIMTSEITAMNIQISLLERDAMPCGRKVQRFEVISCPIFMLNGTMDMEAKSSSESSVPIYQTKWHHTPDGRDLSTKTLPYCHKVSPSKIPQRPKPLLSRLHVIHCFVLFFFTAPALAYDWIRLNNRNKGKRISCSKEAFLLWCI